MYKLLSDTSYLLFKSVSRKNKNAPQEHGFKTFLKENLIQWLWAEIGFIPIVPGYTHTFIFKEHLVNGWIDARMDLRWPSGSLSGLEQGNKGVDGGQVSHPERGLMNRFLNLRQREQKQTSAFVGLPLFSLRALCAGDSVTFIFPVSGQRGCLINVCSTRRQ